MPDGTQILDPGPPTVTTPLDATIPDEAIVPLWNGETFNLSDCVDAVLHSRFGPSGEPPPADLEPATAWAGPSVQGSEQVFYHPGSVMTWSGGVRASTTRS